MKRVDLKLAPSRSFRQLLSVRALDGSVPHIQELITKAGFEDGERVSIVPTAMLDALLSNVPPLPSRRKGG